jgi:protoporphyrin/coproporphyrin ferrochelatase
VSAPKTAVIAMAYGSPARSEEIPDYFADIRGGRPASPAAVAELEERYRRIGGHSPLNEVTESQRAALERELGFPVYVGMKHWAPRISDAVADAIANGAQRIVGLVLAPHYARMSIGGYRARLEQALNGSIELVFIESWHDHEPFIQILADRVRGALASRFWDAARGTGPEGIVLGARPRGAPGRPAASGGGGARLLPAEATAGQGREDAHVVFTAHSLPQRILAEGDPYEEQLLETSRLVAARAGVTDWSFAFQSESPTGEPWLGPDLLEELDRLHATGVRNVLVAPIGFVSDHLEILWDIDVEACERAAALGLELNRIASLNDDPAFIRALADLVRRAVAA